MINDWKAKIAKFEGFFLNMFKTQRTLSTYYVDNMGRVEIETNNRLSSLLLLLLFLDQETASTEVKRLSYGKT